MGILELIELENRFQPFIKTDHYTIIAPSDPLDFAKFIELAHERIPSPDLHSMLSNRVEMRKLILLLKPLPELDVYLIYRGDDTFLFHQDLASYIHEYNINFQI